MARALVVTGEKHGGLTAIQSTHHRTPDRMVVWEWRCECGSLVMIAASLVVRGRCRFCSKFCSKRSEPSEPN